ncbi:MAG: signal peptide peptidase SppA [Treponema sp.]|nr:signal peptide peptidase SppA [Candidatus Treponema scatequi]
MEFDNYSSSQRPSSPSQPSQRPANPYSSSQSASQTKKPSAKKKSGSAGLLVFIVILVGVLGFASYAFLKGDSSSSSSVSRITENSKENFKSFNFNFGNTPSKNVVKHSGDYIAKIYITGVIQDANKTYNQEWLLNTIADLKDDPDNKGIILFIDSPGGSVYESDEAYLALSDYQGAHKPVWAYMGSLAASGGYYISCGAEYICANRNTLTGSIGVIAGSSVDLTGLMERYGIKSKTFTAGRNKNMLNYNCPLTEEQEKIMQSVADECYDQFTNIVAINRKLDIKDVRNLADGRIYTAKQALNNKLIDKICSFDEAVSAMKAKYKFEGVEVVDYEYTYKQNWYDILSGKISDINKSAQSPEGKLIDMVTSDIRYPAYLAH